MRYAEGEGRRQGSAEGSENPAEGVSVPCGRGCEVLPVRRLCVQWIMSLPGVGEHPPAS